MSDNTSRADTIKVRIDDATLLLMNAARAHVKLDKSKFIRESIREKAAAIIAEHEKTIFDTADWRAFFGMLERPAVPTERMVKAARTVQKIDGEA